MSDSDALLEIIENGIVEHGNELAGWTRLDQGCLQLFDGRVTLHAAIQDNPPSMKDGTVHAHVLTTLHDYDDEALDACLMGIGKDRKSALAEAALIWITGVAGPIKSFLDDKPICMTCQVGVPGGDATQGYLASDYGLCGIRAFVGPVFYRGFNAQQEQPTFDGNMPWFRFAQESAAPRRVHLAKTTIFSKGSEGWSRELEVDGHEVAHHNLEWSAPAHNSEPGYLTRFALFEFPPDSPEIPHRRELERTIRYFAENFAQHDSVDKLMQTMVDQGFDADLVQEVESIGTIAFGRMYFEHLGMQYSPYIIRARRNGQVESNVPLMSLASYTRAKAIANQLHATMSKESFEALCCYNAESNVIIQAMESELNFRGMRLYPCIVPDRGVSQQTMDAAWATLQNLMEKNRRPAKKPWWKFW